MRVILTPEGIFFFNRVGGLCVFSDVKKSCCWQKPLYVQIALTNRCNLNCWFCYSSKEAAVYEWSFDRLKELINYLDGWGVFGVAFGGGEVFMYPHLCEAVRYVWGQSGLDVSVTTSGYAAQEHQIKALEGCLSEVRISIRNPKDVSQIAKFLGRGFDVGVNLLLYKDTVVLLEDLINACKNQGVNDFLVNSFIATGKGAKFANKTPTQNDYEKLANLVNKYSKKGDLFKFSGRLAANLEPYLNCGFVPFQNGVRGRVISVSAEGKIKPFSMSKEAYSFTHVEQIESIYRQKIVP